MITAKERRRRQFSFYENVVEKIHYEIASGVLALRLRVYAVDDPDGSKRTGAADL